MRSPGHWAGDGDTEVERALNARRSRRNAVGSAAAGRGLRVAGMRTAALDYMTSVHGAFIQEMIGIAVILNALRALRNMPSPESANYQF